MNIDLRRLEKLIEQEKERLEWQKRREQRLKDLEVMQGLEDYERIELENLREIIEDREHILEALRFLKENIEHELRMNVIEQELEKF